MKKGKHISNKYLKKLLFLLVVLVFFSFLFSCTGNNVSENSELIPEHYLYVNLKSDSNLIFNKYDMNIYLDDKEIGTIANGEEFQKLLVVKEGQHILSVKKKGDEKVFESQYIDVYENTTLNGNLKHKKTKIEIKDMETVSGISGDVSLAENLNEKILSEVSSETTEDGDESERSEYYFYMDIKSYANIFNRYDMEIYLDNSKMETISDGESYQKLIKIEEGSHVISVKKVGDLSVFAEKTIDIYEDSTFQCCIKHKEDKIELKDSSMISEVPQDLLRYEKFKNPSSEIVENEEMTEKQFSKIQEINIKGNKASLKVRRDGGTSFVLSAKSDDSNSSRIDVDDIIIDCEKDVCSFVIRKLETQAEEGLSYFDVSVMAQSDCNLGSYETNIYSAYDLSNGEAVSLATITITVFDVQKITSYKLPAVEKNNSPNEEYDPDSDIIVYITPHGEKYHYLETCPNSDKVTRTTLEFAKKRGLGPCAKCAE